MKAIIITVITLIIILGGSYYVYTSNFFSDFLNDAASEVLNTDEDNYEIQEFGRYSEYFRDDLSNEDKTNLKIILSESEKNIQNTLEDLNNEFVKENSNMEEVFSKLNKTREDIRVELLPFVDEKYILDFEEFFRQEGEEMEYKFVTK